MRKIFRNCPLAATFAALLSLTIAATAVMANPTNLRPKTPLQAHGTISGATTRCQDAKAAVKRLYDLHDSLESKAAKYDEVKADPGRVPHMQLAGDCAKLWLALRDIRQLNLMGEPASVDLQTKVNRLYTKVDRLTYHGVAPNAGQFRQRVIAKLRNETQKRDRFLGQQEQNISSGRLEEAEKALESFGEDLIPQVVFLSPKQKEPFTKRFLGVLGTCDKALSKKRAGIYGQQASAAAAKNLEGVAYFNSEATRIRGELSNSGLCTIGDNKEADAADAIEYLAGLWGKASAGLLRRTGLLWVYSSEDYSTRMATAVKPVKDLEKSATESITAIITTASSKVAAEDVRELYAKILEQLTVIDRRVGGTDFSKACAPALRALAAKNPDLPKMIAAYERSTAEVLRWRKSFARKQADVFRRKYTPAESLNQKKVSVQDSNKPIMYGAASRRERPLLTSTFNQPAEWDVYEAGPFLIDTKVATDQTIRISPTSRTSVVRYGLHQYCNVAVGFELDSQLNALKVALNVDDQHPPLSIASADAISSVKLREFEMIGGKIKQVHLEAVATRFIALPDPAYMLAFLGRIPSIDDSAPAISQTCWRFDIQPHWVQHEYFTFAVPSAMD